MKEIVVLAEHRQGQWRDITFEMLSKGRQLAESFGSEVHAVVLGKGVANSTEVLRPMAHRVLLVEDERLEVFNSETYQTVLAQLNMERKPLLTLNGHLTLGMDLAPNLAVDGPGNAEELRIKGADIGSIDLTKHLLHKGLEAITT